MPSPRFDSRDPHSPTFLSAGFASSLLVAQALILAGAWLSSGESPPPHLGRLILGSVIFAQSGLLGLWLGFGAPRLAVRVPTLVLALGLLTTVVAAQEELGLSLAQVVLPAASIGWGSLVLRHAGTALGRASHASTRRWQISLLQALSFTTAVAVVSGLATMNLPALLPDDFTSDMTIFSLASIPLTAVTAWTLFAARDLAFRLAMTMTTFAAVILMSAIARGGEGSRLVYLVACGVELLILATSLGVLRAARYRWQTVDVVRPLDVAERVARAARD